jgi:hypothetical protein
VVRARRSGSSLICEAGTTLVAIVILSVLVWLLWGRNVDTLSQEIARLAVVIQL